MTQPNLIEKRFFIRPCTAGLAAKLGDVEIGWHFKWDDGTASDVPFGNVPGGEGLETRLSQAIAKARVKDALSRAAFTIDDRRNTAAP